jgi:hypothetical protein
MFSMCKLYGCRMPSSGMLCHLAPVTTDTSEEHNASIIRVTRIGELGTMLTVISNQSTGQRNAVCERKH